MTSWVESDDPLVGAPLSATSMPDATYRPPRPASVTQQVDRVPSEASASHCVQSTLCRQGPLSGLLRARLAIERPPSGWRGPRGARNELAAAERRSPERLDTAFGPFAHTASIHRASSASRTFASRSVGETTPEYAAITSPCRSKRTRAGSSRICPKGVCPFRSRSSPTSRG